MVGEELASWPIDQARARGVRGWRIHHYFVTGVTTEAALRDFVERREFWSLAESGESEIGEDLLEGASSLGLSEAEIKQVSDLRCLEITTDLKDGALIARFDPQSGRFIAVVIIAWDDDGE